MPHHSRCRPLFRATHLVAPTSNPAVVHASPPGCRRFGGDIGVYRLHGRYNRLIGRPTPRLPPYRPRRPPMCSAVTTNYSTPMIRAPFTVPPTAGAITAVNIQLPQTLARAAAVAVTVTWASPSHGNEISNAMAAMTVATTSGLRRP